MIVRKYIGNCRNPRVDANCVKAMDGWMDGWMDLLVGTGVNTALENVQWPKPFLTPAKPLFDYAMILK